MSHIKELWLNDSITFKDMCDFFSYFVDFMEVILFGLRCEVSFFIMVFEWLIYLSPNTFEMNLC